jgi:ubiquinone/menaquinone biosynthesis C-methylase UbiE
MKIFSVYKVDHFSQAWWCMSIIPALGRLKQEDHKNYTSLGYTVRPHLKRAKHPITTKQKSRSFQSTFNSGLNTGD